MSDGSAANWEASVVMSLAPSQLDELLPTSAIRRDISTVVFRPPEREPPLPALLFETATYLAMKHRLEVEPTQGVLAAECWELWIDGECVARAEAGAVPRVVTNLPRHPVTFTVEQRTASGTRQIPILVVDKEHLPLPTPGPQPRGDDVLDYFAGLRTRGEFDASRGSNGATGRERVGLPTIEHLSRFSRALFGIRDSLDRPARSVLEYRARWTGPWGLERVVELLESRITTARDDPPYSLFQVWELDATLGQLALESDERCPGVVKRELRSTTRARLGALIHRLEDRVGDGPATKIMRTAYEEQTG
jgi:hypothetical protein